MVYSVPRTGSTLIWQCLTKIFTKVLKSHRDRIWDYFSGIRMCTEKHGAVLDYSCPCVITERDLMDSFFSQWRNDNWQSEAHFHEWLCIAFSLLLLAHFVPQFQDAMERGWLILEHASDYFWIIILTIVGGSFGSSGITKFIKNKKK